jgi:hypothetical protein
MGQEMPRARVAVLSRINSVRSFGHLAILMPAIVSDWCDLDVIYNCRMNSTRLCFSSGVSLSSRTRLKNSTESSSVKARPSWRYGGLSLIPRSVNALIGPSPASFFRKRSTWRSCIWLSR